MVDIEVVLQNDELIDVKVIPSPEINIDIDSSPEIEVELVGSGPPGKDGKGLPDGGIIGDIIMRTSDGGEWVTPANAAEEDNTIPITSAGVYREIGNINALLATI